MASNQKLELTWIGKEKRAKLEPRILLEDPEKSYHAKQRVSESDVFDNRLIFGDNLLALKALEQEFAGEVKCVFIDPPYNTGSAFTHYDDGLEHSIWLGLMRDRLEIIKRLLSNDGSLWITIDDNECHYLKVLCDEIFGRANYKTTITWQRKYSVSNNFQGIASICDFVLVYSKSEAFKNNLLPRSEESAARYNNPDNDPRGPWKAVDYLNQATPEKRPNLCYDIVNPNTGVVIKNTKKAWKYDPTTHQRHVDEKRIWWGRDGGNSVPALKLFLSEVRDGMTPHNWWSHEEVGHTDESKKEMIGLYGPRDVFDTPKPERLLKRILEIATNPGDLVLDSFAGSGTTGAVAHKMGRRWIMVELGEHCHTHIIPRLKKVIDGEDPGGITNAVDWQGGGGFRYYSLAPSLIVEDRWGNPVINPEYNATQLSEALCKLEGFTYAPSETRWWQQGHSSERDFLYVTTQNLSASQLQALSDEVGTEQSLLVCCSAFHGISAAAAAARWPNLTLKKIPKMVLARCEWGHDDYSLNVANLPLAKPEPETPASQPAPKKKGKKTLPMPDLFGDVEDGA
ncbi:MULTISPECIES: site-specific DNA-methyltransferase [Nitrosomonas]|uniref:site-specific DNA-methyltransferase (adenine-specific) n=2 Tax=Pseudomonadota TaxID=1224 RepID=Q82SK8_NITEU|nr:MULTISPECIES: site-specific DNA-methyltransferase [Nitrosomonas]CAD86221.1 Adenine specific DNA methylase Mod [Nitrosomonas europaea ATCC 19718]SDW30296.1 adenine-specific DNA-methyltransferase [Nitrosomonas europaea]SES89264.1 adenine-specific DNA-methyltransferase [Nitrosomonas europaea]SJZ40189.1 adenine-specific DNA-methyltransferase [Nitrosomonas europaea]HBF25915.1 site-specific DNA-methyltransferase [Nitrosomonas sp.]